MDSEAKKTKHKGGRPKKPFRRATVGAMQYDRTKNHRAESQGP